MKYLHLRSILRIQTSCCFMFSASNPPRNKIHVFEIRANREIWQNSNSNNSSSSSSSLHAFIRSQLFPSANLAVNLILQFIPKAFAPRFSQDMFSLPTVSSLYINRIHSRIYVNLTSGQLTEKKTQKLLKHVKLQNTYTSSRLGIFS